MHSWVSRDRHMLRGSMALRRSQPGHRGAAYGSACRACCVARTAGGLLCHSLAIITDAAHMLSDVAGFLVGAIALVLTSRNANHRYSFGFGRAEVLVALPPSSPALSPNPNPNPNPSPHPSPRPSPRRPRRPSREPDHCA